MCKPGPRHHPADLPNSLLTQLRGSSNSVISRLGRAQSSRTPQLDFRPVRDRMSAKAVFI